MERIKVGTITKPQALKGAFRLKPSILNLKKFKKLKEIFVNNSPYEIEEVSLRDTFVILKVKGIDTCESAEALRNKDVFADMEVENSTAFDMVGWNVCVDSLRGRVIDVNNYGSKDILSLDIGKKCMIPVIDGLIERSEINTQTIYLNNEIFEQVVVYED